MGQERIRSFMAIDIDNEELRGALREAQIGLERTGADLKLVDPENIHITIRFLGEVPADTLETVKEQMNEVRFSPFSAQFNGLGAFPSLDRINVVWVGIRQGESELNGLFGQIEPRLRALGFQPDTKGFNPHVTLARVRTGRNRGILANHILERQDEEFGTLRVTALRLKRSVLTPRGPIYSDMHTVSAVA